MPTYGQLGEAAATIVVVVAAHLRQALHTNRQTDRLVAQVRELRRQVARLQRRVDSRSRLW